MLKIGIVGANGYSGAELVRLLARHPSAQLEMLISHRTKGTMLTSHYPHFQQIIEAGLEDMVPDEIAGRVELLFFATPSGVAKNWVPRFVDKGLKCIDLSGDFRLDGEAYRQWYKREPAPQKELDKAIYGLSEMNADRIKEAQLIANPGCFPTAALLGLLPSVQGGFIDTSFIVIDGKTGVSGAGRTPSLGNLFTEVNENTGAYKVGSHQHTPEIERFIKAFAGKEAKISFTPHLIPMTRGILCTIYAPLAKKVTTEDVRQYYRKVYKGRKFIRIRPAGSFPSTKEVYASNYCDIGVHVDERTGRLVVISAIDNLVKGASGQAIQNMNLLFGLEEDTGLDHVPVYP
ncbi:MAG: N-acetyl-gamma-glutamyl-phosphate reductase [Heyndrickxia faecalis]|uniref:N-acetyl-gamma-glutamyl-phosphate reductase n=1 Tax=Heyndrickxia TaxID=2837504 RepID=UPI0021B4770B|nr:N-acetyl-gamma-glutamyl-phosphate reductase [Heyndrickxia coagulans]UXC20959.1 N-acetyl-gamma-glutamyl-phosphate reductase [Heyndrickxia coagulans]